MHSGIGGPSLKQSSAVSVYIGIASLVLEGRVISTDEDDDDTFLINYEISLNQPKFPDGVETVDNPTGSGSTSLSRDRISEKLLLLRQLPGLNKEVVETSLAIPINAHEDGEFKRQSVRLHHTSSTRDFGRSSRTATVSTSSASNSSLAASVLHDIEVDWNDISVLFNGLDSVMNLPGSPMKVTTAHSFRTPFSSTLPSMHQEPSIKMFKNKEKLAKPKQKVRNN